VRECASDIEGRPRSCRDSIPTYCPDVNKFLSGLAFTIHVRRIRPFKLENNTVHVLHHSVFGSSQESLLRTRNEELEHLYTMTTRILPA